MHVKRTGSQCTQSEAVEGQDAWTVKYRRQCYPKTVLSLSTGRYRTWDAHTKVATLRRLLHTVQAASVQAGASAGRRSLQKALECAAIEGVRGRCGSAAARLPWVSLTVLIHATFGLVACCTDATRAWAQR